MTMILNISGFFLYFVSLYLDLKINFLEECVYFHLLLNRPVKQTNYFIYAKLNPVKHWCKKILT